MSEPTDPIAQLHRYTITSEGASPGYFRLVEDPEGAWVTWAEVANLRAERTEGRPPEATGEDLKFPTDETHWRAMAADTQHAFWFTNREARVMFAEIDRLRGQVADLQSQIETLTAALKDAQDELASDCYHCGLPGSWRGRSDSRATWQPIETAPKDRWVWMFSKKSRLHMATAYVWDDSHEMWYSGLGWWHTVDQYFSHWAEMTGQPPALPSASTEEPQ